MSAITVATMKNTMVPRALVINVWNQSIHCLSLLDLLHSSMNQVVFEKHLCNKSSHYENSLRAKEAMTCNHQINAFHCQQRWMEHKGGHW